LFPVVFFIIKLCLCFLFAIWHTDELNAFLHVTFIKVHAHAWPKADNPPLWAMKLSGSNEPSTNSNLNATTNMKYLPIPISAKIITANFCYCRKGCVIRVENFRIITALKSKLPEFCLLRISPILSNFQNFLRATPLSLF